MPGAGDEMEGNERPGDWRIGCILYEEESKVETRGHELEIHLCQHDVTFVIDRKQEKKKTATYIREQTQETTYNMQKGPWSALRLFVCSPRKLSGPFHTTEHRC